VVRTGGQRSGGSGDEHPLRGRPVHRGGFGSRLLAAVFGFERDGVDAYWIYSFRRGAYYPFSPKGTSDRNQQVEFKLQSVLDGELGLEDDEAYWYPLWPDTPGNHPWE